MKSSNYFPAVILSLLPAISVELLSGNTPLEAYFSLPLITFIILNITYGGALLLIRETVVRWGKGFASVLIFAAGYAMSNEALETKGFFDPHFYSAIADGLEGFGRVFGINVPWALHISIVHAVFSILVPFILVTTIFPGKGRWIGNKLYATLIVAFIAVITFSFKVFVMAPSYYHYDEGPGPLLLILSLMAIVILAAWKIPRVDFSKWNIQLSPVILFILGVIYGISFNFLPYIVRTTTNSPAAYELFVLIFFVALPILLMAKLPSPTPRSKVALAAGLLFFWLLHGIFGHTPGTIFGVVVVLSILAAAFVRTGAPALPNI
jgi:hypothetical protein